MIHDMVGGGSQTVRSNARNSDTSSVSLVDSRAATIDTVNLEHIAEQLVSSDELMRVLARRLGLPESQVVAADDLSSVFSITSIRRQQQPKGGAQQQEDGYGDRPLLAPRDNWIDNLHEREFDSDEDLWSDEDDEVGDAGEEETKCMTTDTANNFMVFNSLVHECFVADGYCFVTVILLLSSRY
jgi:hypothetical protein